MATQADVRRICLSLPGTVEAEGRFAFELPVKGKLKGYAWVWLERLDPKKARVPQPKVLSVRTANLDDKEFLLSLDTRKFFTEPHYNGYPAVMVRLPEIKVSELRPLLEEAWRVLAPKGADPSTARKAVVKKKAKKK